MVLLLRFPKYVWTTEEDFKPEVEVANYSNQSFTENLEWEIRAESGEMLQEGMISDPELQMGRLTGVGELEMDLSGIEAAKKLLVHISLPGTSYTNTYPIWVYPRINIPDSEEIHMYEQLDEQMITTLQQGGKVLLFPPEEAVKDQSVGGLFPPNFWNYEMFKGISEGNNKPYSPGTLGLLTDPKHPLFDSFPTDFHTNWQWFSIIKASNPMILDQTSAEYRPLVQVIDNLQRNHKLGLIFEFKVGNGKLLSCMAKLPQLTDKPEARLLYN